MPPEKEAWRPAVDEDGWYDDRDNYTYCVQTPVRTKSDKEELADKENQQNRYTSVL